MQYKNSTSVRNKVTYDTASGHINVARTQKLFVNDLMCAKIVINATFFVTERPRNAFFVIFEE